MGGCARTSTEFIRFVQVPASRSQSAEPSSGSLPRLPRRSSLVEELWHRGNIVPRHRGCSEHPWLHPHPPKASRRPWRSKGQGVLDDASPPAGIAQSWRGDLCITAARWLAFPCREKPPSAHNRCRLERTPRAQRPCCPRKRWQLRKLHCVSASRGVQPVSRWNAEISIDLACAITP